MPRRLLVLLVLACGTTIAWREWRVRPAGDVAVHVLDVGQGDALFITGPSGQQVLIDGGPNLDVLAGIGKRMSLFDRTIDLLVLSHPDQDHVFGLPEVLRRYRVGAVLLTGVVHGQPRYEEMLGIIEHERIPVIIADPARDIDLGDGLLLDVLWPPPTYLGREASGATNDTSIVFKLVYGEDSMLFTGDMELREEEDVLASGADIAADILKVAHHGSRTSTSTGFLLAADPDLALISVGRDNSFGHPHPHVLDRLRHFHIPIRTTAEEGTISIELDGIDEADVLKE